VIFRMDECRESAWASVSHLLQLRDGRLACQIAWSTILIFPLPLGQGDPIAINVRGFIEWFTQLSPGDDRLAYGTSQSDKFPSNGPLNMSAVDCGVIELAGIDCVTQLQG